MQTKILLISMMFAILSGLFAAKTIQVWRTDSKLSSETIKQSPVSNGTDNKRTLFNQPRTASKSEFSDIATKNLFSEERSEFQPEAPEEDVVPAKTQSIEVDGKKIVLFGVIIVQSDRRALISDPESKPGIAGTRWVRVGDTVNQLRVVKISQQSIMFADGGKNYQIDLYDQENKQRASIDAAPQRAQPTVVVTQQPAQTKPAIEKKGQPAGQPADNGDELVKTPFGMIKRKK